MTRYDWHLEKIESNHDSLIVLGAVDDKNRVLASLDHRDYKVT